MFTIGAIFWILYLVGIIFYGIWTRTQPWFWSSLFFWVMLFLLGVGTFGFPVK